ncbi:hypothetical protein [Candidatus Aciduliprofundum boonei]|uniref:Uncharacterized protein n=1 Tax=Aciduliprofundum boonei (strain DSM 19572 / T469) TaxID=439481 RepID=B5IFQ3_ACIB4|nr:hypothetical protein [Candidatus Aciduliprofundum boonei]ADD08985.1 conserved hypothetical protein [Aciduliprofundum boonei T469]EDY34941.1 hypothetical protein ABOONEI_1207 [Aciduliprofundum boonei T469]HII55185.1 hypothetical protein [Candidatus Aciduliprofundum boonei]
MKKKRLVRISKEPEVPKEQFNNWMRYVVQSSMDLKEMEALLYLQKMQRAWTQKAAKEWLIAKTGAYNIIGRLRNTGLMIEVGEEGGAKLYSLLASDEIRKWLSRYGGENMKLSTEEAMREYQDVVLRLKTEYEFFVKNVREDDVEEWISQIHSIGDIVEYVKSIMGDKLYMDALLPIIQQYSIANVPIYSSANPERRINQTGFSLAYFGEPGTGKTFATDDLLRGKEEKGVPPHGMIGRLRYAQGMTPKMFIAILEAYQDYPVDWVIPEFKDFFAYRGMVEKLKLVMERREVRDETRTATIGPYKVTSFFIVNYNTQVNKGRWKSTINDPNFNAVEDRMLCKLFLNTHERRKLIWENMKRIAAGKVDYYLAEPLRKHMTYTYHLLNKQNARVIVDEDDFIRIGDDIAEAINEHNAPVSLRIIDRALQIAASSSLVRFLAERENEIWIDRTSLELAENFVMDEIEARAKRL